MANMNANENTIVESFSEAEKKLFRALSLERFLELYANRPLDAYLEAVCITSDAPMKAVMALSRAIRVLNGKSSPLRLTPEFDALITFDDEQTASLPPESIPAHLTAVAALSRRLFKLPTPSDLRLDEKTHRVLHAALGVSGEAGEIIDAVKKSWVYGSPLDVQNLVEEVGDAIFYLAALCEAIGCTLEQAIEANVEKLTKRYPSGGYTDADAIARADKDDKSGAPRAAGE